MCGQSKHLNRLTWGLCLWALTAAAASAQALPRQQLQAKYLKMAPLAQYLMNRNDEIALARSAAPAAISANATILVLTRRGWITAVQGSNGFVCDVERGWTSSLAAAERWNPHLRGANCLNPIAAKAILPRERLLTDLTLARDSQSQRIAAVRAAIAQHRLPPVEPGALGYMMSKHSWLDDNAPHDLAHVMFYLPTRRTNAAWGGGLPHVPLFSFSYWFPDPFHASPLEPTLPAARVLIVAVPYWSDGTPATAN